MPLHALPASELEDPLDYFSRARIDLLKALPSFSERVLEIGCGSGVTPSWMKSLGLAGHTTGIELAPKMAKVAGKNVDELIMGDEEALLDDVASAPAYDLVLCLDVLEHFVDLWRMIEKISQALRPAAVVIASIPNVRHLVFLCNWYLKDVGITKSGILDHTHHRFFPRPPQRGCSKLTI